MSNLTIKQFDWNFDGIEFYWNPNNREFSSMMNGISFAVLGMERYFCQAVKDAEAHITDPVVLQEAQLFGRQEMIHSKAHMRHCKALVGRYPGLQDAIDCSFELYGKVYEENDLKHHLAYSGGLESVFTPFFGSIIENRDVLFGGGDPRFSSMLLWHFLEEIEHRSSAITIYNHVYGDHIYRLRMFKKLVAHGGMVLTELEKIFASAVPEFDTPKSYMTGLEAIPKAQRIKTSLKIFASQMPRFNHDRQRLPDYFSEWNGRYQAGEDMRLAYGPEPHKQAA